MKKTAYFCALLLAVCLCACGNMNDAQVTSSPAPTMTIIPEVMPEATAGVNPDTPSVSENDNSMMSNGSVTSPSPMPVSSPSPAVPGEEMNLTPGSAGSTAE